MIPRVLLAVLFLCLPLLRPSVSLGAEPVVSIYQQAMAETFDLWRDGKYEQQFERLAHRGKTSKEQFVTKMRAITVRPACCWRMMEDFRILSEKSREAVVYAKVGLEGAGAVESSTREFKLTFEEGIWKIKMNDIFDLAGAKSKKGTRGHGKRNKHSTTVIYQ